MPDGRPAETARGDLVSTGTNYGIMLDRQRFGSDFGPPEVPVLDSPLALRVFAKAFNVQTFGEAVVDFLRQGSLAFCHLEYLETELGTGYRFYRLTIADAVEGDPHPTRTIKFNVVYDPRRDEIAQVMLE